MSLDELKKGKILFYDNTKLSFCNYMATFTRIKERFEEMGISHFVNYRETVRGKDTKTLEAYGAMMAEEKPTAAVVALGDMGTSAATCVVSIALEKLGIPTVYITAPPGGELVEGVAFYRANHLCLCKIDIFQASTKEEISDQIDNRWDYIIDALTASGDQLQQIAAIDLAMDQTAPDPEGLLHFVENIQIEEDKLYEPGCYLEEINDYFNAEHISDGLPIIPPTRARYDKMLSYCPFDEGLVLCYEVGPTGKNITVKRHCRSGGDGRLQTDCHAHPGGGVQGIGEPEVQFPAVGNHLPPRRKYGTGQRSHCPGNRNIRQTGLSWPRLAGQCHHRSGRQPGNHECLPIRPRHM